MTTHNNGLGVKSAVYLEFFTNTLKNVSRHVKLIAGIDSYTGTDLILLLSRHNLTVGSGNFNSSIQTSAIVGLGDGAAKVVLGTDGTVVRSLGAGWNASLGPA